MGNVAEPGGCVTFILCARFRSAGHVTDDPARRHRLLLLLLFVPQAASGAEQVFRMHRLTRGMLPPPGTAQFFSGSFEVQTFERR